MTQQQNDSNQESRNYVNPNSLPLPTVWPTLLVTMFFGLFGIIPAIMHTKEARMAGQPTEKYWTAFLVTGILMVVAWLLVLNAVGGSFLF